MCAHQAGKHHLHEAKIRKSAYSVRMAKMVPGIAARPGAGPGQNPMGLTGPSASIYRGKVKKLELTAKKT